MIDEGIHLVTRALLRSTSPLLTHRILGAIGSVFPELRGRVAIAKAMARLALRGTCLSRALAISARAPDADVVIGAGSLEARHRFRAHAWLEIDGEPLESRDSVGTEVARMRARRRRPCGADTPAKRYSSW